MAASDNLSNVQFETEPDGVWAHHGDSRYVAHLGWTQPEGNPRPYVSGIILPQSLQGKGIATGMWNEAQKATGGQLTHSPFRTDDGDAWAQKVGGHLPARRTASSPEELDNWKGD